MNWLFRAGIAFVLATPAAQAAPDWTLATFCTEVQRVTTSTTVPFTQETHKTSWDYRHSKPGIEPVVIHEYVTPDAAGRPKMVSCKVKTVDHLQAVYGADAARNQGSCEQVTRSMVEQAASRVTPRSPKIIVEPEERVWAGSQYLAPFELLSRDDKGAIHLHTRYMRIDWEDWRWWVMPNKLRGHLYCSVVAPEYLGRILAGEKPELEPIEIPPEP